MRLPGALLATTLLATTILSACSSSSPATPAFSALPSSTLVGDHVLLGEFDLSVDPTAATASLEPVRESTAIGDEYLLDLGATLNPLCSDCFQVRRFAKTANNEIAIDFLLRHPFPVDFPKKQYDVFDVRLITLVPLGSEAFNETLPGPNGIIATNAQIISNAHGYTTHFTERYPGIFRSTVHPFLAFFTEDNPDPESIGAPIPEHRMTLGQFDEQRMLLVPPSPTPFKLRLVLEARYIEAADNRSPEQPGGSANPVFFLPEGHQDEPYKVDVVVEGNPVQVGVPEDLTIRVTVVDWQAGVFTDPSYPDLSNPGALDPAEGLGGLGQPSCEIPVIFYFEETPSTTLGLGTLASPRVWTFVVPFEVTSVGRYPILIAVSDARQPADLTGLGSLADLRAFRIAWIDVLP